mmetsp:Transcript_4754/g.10637  ORF Transcript_4754/g.10637 Transcript_4754/m.10637 type:complete len:485 (+) Transcript_4754:133-1587(+)|eukprot:CAMPEP_0201122922 /NCGR_PEP_ID=MMETSP0850-20130426/6436_1 /ASSEMBLY_ACC=CAM_ASM_000622 /TAXON_ID=183588 /ORGANISM="Pseudo-nitzschia fraudulenta, Strain WWA7" /LENGTH=484 /DNA_ID=CAMNT_0047389713 /DNA_START=101 /DNA_END=1555 /DNA_ORIENTATION=+
MMFRITAITTYLAASASVSTTLSTSTTILVAAQEEEPPTACYDYSELLKMELGPEECTARSLFRKLKNAFNEAKSAPGASKCRGGFHRDLQALTGTGDSDAAWQTLQDLCDSALEDASDAAGTDDWNVLTNGPAGIPLDDFFDGKSFLNLETGNFQQKESEFIKKGGYERFLVIGEDPRENEHYPTSEASYQAGRAVLDFYKDQAKNKFLSAPTSGFQSGCQASHAAVCCWSRDRQYLDKNGDCDFRDCAKQNPSDNTDLCWTEENGKVFPYPGDETENDLHCHGFSWGTDESGFDANSSGRWNNLFYVSLYDHMYQRGYVESLTNDPKIHGLQPMCGCVEDMAPVARADCTEIVGLTDYTTYQDPVTKILVVESVPDTFGLDFQQCEGFDYVEGFGPEDYEADPKARELKRSKNDLAAFVYRQYLERKIDEDHMNAIEDTIIGLKKSDIRKSEKKQDEACREAFEERFPGREFKEVMTESMAI